MHINEETLGQRMAALARLDKSARQIEPGLRGHRRRAFGDGWSPKDYAEKLAEIAPAPASSFAAHYDIDMGCACMGLLRAVKAGLLFRHKRGGGPWVYDLHNRKPTS